MESKNVIMESFCRLIKITTAAFYRSLEVVRILGRKKGKIIIFGHKCFLKEFSHHMPVQM